MDVSLHNISAGKDSNKISIRKFATKRVRIIAFALIPTLFIGGTASALEPTNSVLTFEQCMALDSELQHSTPNAYIICSLPCRV